MLPAYTRHENTQMINQRLRASAHAVVSAAFAAAISVLSPIGATGQSYVSGPRLHPGHFTRIWVPLLLPNGGMDIQSVPALVLDGPPQNFFDAMSSPVHAAAERRLSERDLNLISLAKITISFARNGAEPAEIHIDLSKARKPEGSAVELIDIVRGLTVCLRMFLSPEDMRQGMTLKVVGAQDPATYQQFEGALWQTKLP
jgi:hypothetical protein